MSLPRLVIVFLVIIFGILVVTSLLARAGIIALPDFQPPAQGPPGQVPASPQKSSLPLPASFGERLPVTSYQGELERASFLPGQESRWVIREWWEAPGRFRNESRQVEPAGQPDERIFVSDGQTAWFYQPAQGLVIISDAGELETNHPFVSNRAELAALLSPKAKRLRALWEGTALVADRACVLLVVGDAFAPTQQRVCLDQETYFPLRLETIDPTLDVVDRIEYVRIEYNSDLPEDLFVFQVPLGVEVIDQRN